MYSIYKRQGSRGLSEFIADRDLVKFREMIPRHLEGSSQDEVVDSLSLELYCRLFEEPSEMKNIYITNEYPQVATAEKMAECMDYTNPQCPKIDMKKAREALQPKKKSLTEDYIEAIEGGSDLSYRLDSINEATGAIRTDLVREEEKEQNNDNLNIE